MTRVHKSRRVIRSHVWRVIPPRYLRIGWVSLPVILLQHLLKWQFQPGRHSTSWRLSIENTRLQLEDHLNDNPSLKSQLSEAVRSAYRRAVNEAVAETGFPRTAFPTECPYNYDQAMAPDFWPE